MKRELKGSLLVFASGIAWSFSGVLSKGFMWSGFSKAGVRGLIAVFMFAALRKTLRVKLTPATILGALGVGLTSLLYMSAIKYTTSANAIVLQYTMPIYVVLFNWLFLKQRPGIRELVTVPLVLLGVIFCCLGTLGTGALPGNLMAIVSGITFALVYIAPRLGETDSLSYTYLGNLMSVLFIAFLPFDENVHFGFSADILGEWFTILLLGISLGAGYMLLALGMKEGASPLTAALLSNVEPVMNPVWVYIFLGEAPGVLGILGCAIVLVTVTVYSVLPEKSSGAA